MIRLPDLVVPFRFATIENGLFRGAYPSLKSMRFLSHLKLTSIVTLSPDPAPTSDLLEFCTGENIKSFHFLVPKYDDSVTLNPALAASILSVVINADNLPLYLHCRDGGNNTGLVVMCLRRLQHWSISSLFDEFSRFVKTGEISREESNFVESFKAEVVVPSRIPAWLWQGVRIRAHPSVLLKLAKSTNDNKKLPHSGESQEITGAVYHAPIHPKSKESLIASESGVFGFPEPMSAENTQYLHSPTDEARAAKLEESEKSVRSGVDQLNDTVSAQRSDKDRKWKARMEAFDRLAQQDTKTRFSLSSNLDALLVLRSASKDTNLIVFKEVRLIDGLGLEGLPTRKAR